MEGIFYQIICRIYHVAGPYAVRKLTTGRAGSAAPVLTTERLRLRSHRAADLDALAAMWADASVARHIGGRPATREEAWARLLRYVGHWSLLGFGYWVVEERASGAFVDEVGFGDFKRDIEPSFGDALEAGWALAPSAQGRGYATEAVRAALRWADEDLGRRRTVCLIAPENEPSRRLAARCGFVEFARATYREQPTLLFERG
jgi:RimJ/RimL family protein N-acetyltransferase